MYKLGIDVGGTNTDAVLISNDLDVIAEIKRPTSLDIYSGIVDAIRSVLDVSGVEPEKIQQAMLGTTQCTNAIVERKHLAPVALIRIGAPATTGLPPMVDWAEDIRQRPRPLQYPVSFLPSEMIMNFVQQKFAMKYWEMRFMFPFLVKSAAWV